MFDIKYLYELMRGELSADGYKHILSVIEYYIRKYNWPRSIVVSDTTSSSKYWSHDEIKEFLHQYFEWLFTKNKLKYLNKIPESYLAYYFSVMLATFAADKIREAQMRQGISYDKVKEIIKDIVEAEYLKKEYGGKPYYFNKEFVESSIKTTQEIEERASYLSKIPITEETKHYKPLVKMAIQDLFNVTESPLTIEQLQGYVYSLFDQKGFLSEINTNELNQPATDLRSDNRYDTVIRKIASGISSLEAKIISDYVFQRHGQISLSELSQKYNMPKSTLQAKIDDFKKKIIEEYVPASQDEGLEFINKLSTFLDEMSK